MAETETHADFDKFVATIAALRAPGGCPWDREQTHESIAHNMIEEAYESVDAIDSGDAAHLREELGDVLLQVVLQSQIAADAGEFTIDDVCADINAKMVRRHPHVFGEASAQSAADVLDIWDGVKLAEKKTEGEGCAAAHTALLDSVPNGMPALIQAQKLSRKMVAAGFEWDTVDDVWDAVFGEIEELRAASPEEAELELGDVLFTVVNVGRKMHLDAESALRATCDKVRRRWAFIEGAAWAEDREVEDLSMDEMQALWDAAKVREHGE